jgi:hypothetical protein
MDFIFFSKSIKSTYVQEQKPYWVRKSLLIIQENRNILASQFFDKIHYFWYKYFNHVEPKGGQKSKKSDSSKI